MKTPEFIFIDSGPASTFRHLMDKMNGKSHDEHTLVVNDDCWKGYIKQIEPETGLYLQIWNCALKAPVLLKRLPADNAVPSACNIIYTLTPMVFNFQKPENAKVHLTARTNTFFTTNFTQAEFELTAHTDLRAIFISLTVEWMQKQFEPSVSQATESILSLSDRQKPVFHFDTTSASEYLLITEIFEHANNDENNGLFFHSRALLLISQFLDKLFIRNNTTSDESACRYFDQLKKAETIIGSYLASKLPAIKEIAEMLEMNETTLNRYFKQVYGKTIYDYYLYKKMDAAKRLFVEKNLNVKEVALHLGYEKTSNFIESFKKHFGYLPGSIRKNNRPA